MEKKYRVTGNWQGESIDKEVMAYSDKQAKFKAGITSGIAGKNLKEFMKSKSVRAIRIP